MKKRKTVGQEAYDRMLNPDPQQGVIDTQREMTKGYFDELKKCAESRKDLTKPFYIVVLSKKERLMENVIRNYFISRVTMPNPDWDQAVYRYDPSCGDLKFLWVLPDINTAKWLAGNPSEVPVEQYELYKYVMMFLDHKLFEYYYSIYHKDELDVENPYQTSQQLILETQ